jgi:hypothetical protein
LTGTFGGAIGNQLGNRSYPFTFAIASANTFEYKTVTIPGDTTGTWPTDNGGSINLWFSMGAGPDRKGTAGAWNANFNTSATGAVDVNATNGATFYLTGVQLEAGSVATPFERRPYGMELALCKRYYQQGMDGGVASGRSSAPAVLKQFEVEMRAAPTVSFLNNYNLFFAGIENFSTNGVGEGIASTTKRVFIDTQPVTSWSGSAASCGLALGAQNGYSFNAEL